MAWVLPFTHTDIQIYVHTNTNTSTPTPAHTHYNLREVINSLLQLALAVVADT